MKKQRGWRESERDKIEIEREEARETERDRQRKIDRERQTDG